MFASAFARTPASIERRNALVLYAWEAVSTERQLQGVLEAVSAVLVPVVPFKGLGIVSFQGASHDLYALHVVGMPFHEGETLEEFFRRPEMAPLKDVPARPRIPYTAEGHARAEAGIPGTVGDLLEKDAWYDHEFHLAAGGVRAYCAIPLLVRGKLIGLAVFTRTEPVAYTDEELAILSNVARALAVAVSNALANEEIRKLRDQLEAENTALRTVLGQTPWFEDIIGESPALRRVLDTVDQVATTDATVLINGETGTGKELMARAIHRRSSRARGPLIKVNCAAIPETLLASELFGHERGAFTGAAERRKGRFEQAHGGTLFLDEVGEMPPDTQVMLLRVLQEREFERLGGNQTVSVDVRIVAASNCDLAELVKSGQFRRDLYYRLNVFPIHMPPLRERPEDIPLLAGHFAGKYAERFGRKITRIDARTMTALRSYSWPGNVRELENEVERAVILAQSSTLRITRDAAPGSNVGGNLVEQLHSNERESIESALRATGGRIAGVNGAARRLGLAPSTLEFRIKRLGIDKFRYRGWKPAD